MRFLVEEEGAFITESEAVDEGFDVLAEESFAVGGKVMDLSDWLIGVSLDLELLECIILINQEESLDAHLVAGKCTRFIRANDRGAAQGFYRGEFADNRVLLGHSSRAQGEAGGDHGR